MYNPPPPPGYSHYQPAPQPLSMPPPANPPPPAQRMGVGNHAGDFELFGPPPTLSNATTSVSHKPAQPRRTIPIPSSGSSSESSSIGDGDYPPVPELVADDGNAPSPPVSFSPPSPDTASTTAPAPAPARPGLLPHASSSKGSSSTSFYGRNGSYHNGGGFERASSVPAPECPRPMRRKTQESRDWPSFYSSSSSSSASSTGGGSYLQTPGLTDSKPLVVDEPTSFITPTVSTAGATNPFDVSSFALSPPAPQYPFYSASPPYPDHPLLPSEQSDLLDRVRRDLLDVDLSSIKGPLRALALSSGVSEGARQFGGDRETTPTQNMAAGAGDPMLSSPNPTAWNNPSAASAAQHLLRSPAMSSASDATVSPQEAFLDYDEVDSRLHDPSRPRGSEFGASLFAPLPPVAAPPPPPPPPAAAAAAAAEMRSPPTRDVETSSSPPPPSAAAPTSPILRATSPRAAHAHGHGHHHSRRGPHPFSVPQNAVTWAEQRSRSGQRVLVGGDAADDDGDFGTTGGEEEEETDEGSTTKVEEQVEPPPAAVRGGFAAPRPPTESSSLAPTLAPTPAAAPTPTPTPTPAQPQPQPQSVVATAQEEQDIKPFLVGKSALPPSTTSFNPLLPLEAVSQSVVRSGGGGFPGFAPPPPPQTGSGSAQPGMSAFQQELARQRGLGSSSSAVSVSEGRSGTATPRRSAAATALAGLNHDHMYSTAPEHPAAAGAEDVVSSGGGRPQRQRKRSRMAMSAYGDDSDADAAAGEEVPSSTTSRLGFAAPPAKSTLPPPPPVAARRSKSVEEEFFDDDGDDFAAEEGESDESYRSSGSSFGATRRGHKAGGNAPPPNKRRRRAPTSNPEGGSGKKRSSNSGGSNAPVPSGGIECNHQNADGSICGVIFRRPYDLARHKETIHGEGLKGEKVKAKEWRCEECGGTFSRKDALLRHGRIRGHVTG